MRLLSDSPDLAPVPVETARIAEQFTRLVRSFTRMRQQFLAEAKHDVERSAAVVLRCLANEGPLRASSVAEKVDSDPSTVSRQVAVLVRDGLVERRADPDDGRASLLVLTDKAGEVLAEHDELRNRHFALMLADWSEADRRTFAALLERFTDDYVRTKNDWIPARPTTGTPAEGND